MDVTPFQPTKLLFYRDRVEAMLRGDFIYPVAVEFDLANTCNHGCSFCSFGTVESQGYRYQNWGIFPADRALALLDELRACGVESVTFTGGGEPLMNPAAASIMQRASDLGFNWGLVTNGYLLTGAVAHIVARGATFVRVSLDAGSDTTHMQTHRTRRLEYSTIIENIRRLILDAESTDRPTKLVVGASFCVMANNFKEVYAAARDVKSAGGDYLEVRPTFETEWRGDGWKGEIDPEAAKVEVEHARMHLNGGGFSVIGMTERFDNVANATPVKNYSTCRVGPLTTVIGAEGSLWHCCVQRGQPFFNLGSVLDKPFAEVWATAMAHLDNTKIDVTKCPRCRYDGYNELIERAFISDGMHRSFI